jgi:hypothetical protein
MAVTRKTCALLRIRRRFALWNLLLALMAALALAAFRSRRRGWSS